MLLNSGVGSLWNHEHEFSTRTQLQQKINTIPRRSPLKRSAFSTPPPAKPTIYEDSETIIPRSERPLSDITLRTKEPTVRFQEVEQETMSEDGRSFANSEVSETTLVGGKRRSRTIRKSTTFQLAHPAPTLTQKQRLLHIRPKLLLQLQRLSLESRPTPALDILPSTIVVPRLMKRFPRMFKSTAALGYHDVIVVKSEEYDADLESNMDESDSDEEGIARRDLVAVICQMRRDLGGSRGKAEIVLRDGSLWVASPLPNGLHEFVTTDERGHTTTARWVRRSTKRRSADVSDPANLTNDVKFTFSIIDPNSRRHPVLATLTQSKLDIPDTYTSVSPSSGKYPPTSPIPQSIGEPVGDEEISTERTTYTIDESMKTFIQVTSIWVALRQGWSPYFRYGDPMAVPNIQTSVAGRVRSSSLTPDSVRPGFGTASSTPDSCSSAIGAALSNKMRRSSARVSPANISPEGDRFLPPKRSLSTGTAYMQRAAARRAVGQPPSTVASDSEGESAKGAFSLHPLERATQPALHRMSTPPCLTLPCSSTTTPDTPTRPQRRVLSAYIPTSNLQNGSLEMDSTTTPPKESTDRFGKVKLGRWKQFTNLFRRKHHSSKQ